MSDIEALFNLNPGRWKPS